MGDIVQVPYSERATYSDALREHLPLARAAAAAYEELIGRSPEAQSREEVLNRVAHALSQVAPVYVFDFSGMPREIEPPDFVHSCFERGATVLRMSNGTEYHDLVMHRGDLQAAINMLKGAWLK